MDKQTKGITVKINGQEKTFSEEIMQHDEQEQAATTEEEEWGIPNIEHDANVADKVVYIEDLRDIKKKNVKLAKKTAVYGGTPFKKALMIGILAAVIGTGLGMGSLHMLTANNLEAETPSSSIVTAQQPTKTETTKPLPTAQSANLDVFTVQAGVFSTEKAAKEGQEELKKKGYAASVVKKDETYLLFIGVGMNQSDAKSLSGTYKGNGVDSFAKSYTIQSLDQKVKPIYEQLAGQSVQAALGQDVDSVSDAEKKLTNMKETSEVKKLREVCQLLGSYRKDKKAEDATKAQELLLTVLSDHTS